MEIEFWRWATANFRSVLSARKELGRIKNKESSAIALVVEWSKQRLPSVSACMGSNPATKDCQKVGQFFLLSPKLQKVVSIFLQSPGAISWCNFLVEWQSHGAMMQSHGAILQSPGAIAISWCKGAISSCNNNPLLQRCNLLVQWCNLIVQWFNFVVEWQSPGAIVQSPGAMVESRGAMVQSPSAMGTELYNIGD